MTDLLTRIGLRTSARDNLLNAIDTLRTPAFAETTNR